MRKFTFSMEHVLKVRITLKEVRESELQHARNRLNEEIDKLTGIEDGIRSALDPARVSRENPGDYLLQREKYVKRLKTERLAQVQKVEDAEKEVNDALDRLKSALVEMKKMEKCREREYRNWKKEFVRDEQKQNDEVSNALFCYKSRLLGVDQ